MSIDFGMSRSDFISGYQERKPLLLRKAIRQSGYCWADANALFVGSDVADASFKLAFDGIRPKHEYVERHVDIGTIRHRLIKPVVYKYLRRGATLIANKIKHDPKVDRFVRAVGELTGRQVVSSAYASFGHERSFRCHWDTRDVFAVQLIGRKRWVVYRPSFESPLYVQQSKDREHLTPCPAQPYMDFVLEAGDVFYLPRGWWHDPLPMGEGSFHLALGTFPAYTVDYLNWVIEQLQEFPEARQSLNHWENDEENLAKVGRHLDAFVRDPLNYQRFMDQFDAAKRVDSPLSIEQFGDPRKEEMPDATGLRICAYGLRGLDQDYIVHHGRKIELDAKVATWMRWIAKEPGITLKALLDRIAVEDRERTRDRIIDFCHQDILMTEPAKTAPLSWPAGGGITLAAC